jgi:hypothetical protein
MLPKNRRRLRKCYGLSRMFEERSDCEVKIRYPKGLSSEEDVLNICVISSMCAGGKFKAVCLDFFDNFRA